MDPPRAGWTDQLFRTDTDGTVEDRYLDDERLLDGKLKPIEQEARRIDDVDVPLSLPLIENLLAAPGPPARASYLESDPSHLAIAPVPDVPDAVGRGRSCDLTEAAEAVEPILLREKAPPGRDRCMHA